MLLIVHPLIKNTICNS